MGEKAVTAYRLVIPDLQLPTLNQVLRWSKHKRDREVQRVRKWTEYHALQQGLRDAKAFESAKVTITVSGPFRDTSDEDGIYTKDLLDALVARYEYARIGSRRIRITGTNGKVQRRWGLVVDDNRKRIGKADVRQEKAVTWRVDVLVEGFAHV